MESSGADKGFFQKPPVLTNQFHDDVYFRRCFKLFLPADIMAKTEAEVAALGQDVLADQIFAWVTDAERNQPYVKGSGRDVFGRRVGELVTTEGWRELQNFGIAKGVVACGYDTPYGAFSRPLQFLRLHLWTASCANVGCPSAMQDGAASLLRKHLTSPKLTSQLSPEQRRVFEDAYRRLTSRDPSVAWTSGQWMTERPGGSDVSRTETTAVYRPDGNAGFASKQQQLPLGPWSINGFKWFSSATDSRMAVLLAQTQDGLSAFLAPMRKHEPSATTMTGQPLTDGECLNGVQISRLKNKFGTQSLPTAELVLEDMRGWLVGQEGKGILEISAMLNLTRIHSAIGAVGGIGRGLGVARAYTKVREIGAGMGARIRLIESPLHMRTLAKMTAEYHSLMLLSIYASYTLGLAEHPLGDKAAPTPALAALTPQAKLVEPLLRVLTQLTKAYVCKASVPLMFACMESLGGVGYLFNEEAEYLNMSRIFRDMCVGPIWEGTTDVLCTDFVRALKHPKGGAESLAALEEVITKASAFQGKQARPSGWDPVQRWASLKDRIVGTSQGDLVGEGRELLWGVAEVLASVLLYVDAATDGNPATEDIFHRFVEGKLGVGKRARGAAKDELSRDLAIVYGTDSLGSASKL
ncbi:Putative acyl-CoA dehydrogenase AidB [Tolypocladium paradoxum]|uniref:Acyl-CoA dehydrogenase AidB n=1 Tax=Tolypocladium paradoxum TaxID=94208 RepID=A0A2S4KSC8_9HYPO|nr:Putative acyl-CoA dehydrogenase AidB [Tolypocladium paradoxum]